MGDPSQGPTLASDPESKGGAARKAETPQDHFNEMSSQAQEVTAAGFSQACSGFVRFGLVQLAT